MCTIPAPINVSALVALPKSTSPVLRVAATVLVLELVLGQAQTLPAPVVALELALALHVPKIPLYLLQGNALATLASSLLPLPMEF